MRKRRGITQVRLSQRIGLSQSYYSKCEKGYIQFSTHMLKRVADALNVDVELLRTGAVSRAA